MSELPATHLASAETETTAPLLPVIGGPHGGAVAPEGGSNWAAVANLFKALFGAGVLSMPYAFSKVGLVLGLVAYVVLFLICLTTMMMLVRCMRSAQVVDPSIRTYADLAFYAFGSPGRQLVQALVVLLEMAFCTGFVIVIIDNMETLGVSKLLTVAVMWPLLVVLSWIKKLADLWLISVFGLLVYVAGVMGAALHDARTSWAPPADVRTFHWSGLGYFCGSAVYSLEGINLIIPIANSVKNPADAPWVVSFSITGYFILTCGYAAVTYAAGMGGCVVVTDCLVNEDLANVVRVALSVALLLTHPITLFPASEILEQRFFDAKDPSFPRQQMALRTFLATVTCVVGASVVDFSVFSDLVGALGVTVVGFFVPPALYAKLSNNASMPLCFAIAAVGFCIMIDSTTTTIKGILD